MNIVRSAGLGGRTSGWSSGTRSKARKDCVRAESIRDASHLSIPTSSYYEVRAPIATTRTSVWLSGAHRWRFHLSERSKRPDLDSRQFMDLTGLSRRSFCGELSRTNSIDKSSWRSVLASERHALQRFRSLSMKKCGRSICNRPTEYELLCRTYFSFVSYRRSSVQRSRPSGILRNLNLVCRALRIWTICERY